MHRNPTLLLALALSAAVPTWGDDVTSYSGAYGVGLIDVEIPLLQARNISDATLVSTGRPAFLLESVLFSAYYPASKTGSQNATEQPHPWIPPPVELVAQGLSAYLNSTGSQISPMLIQAGLQGLAGGLAIGAAVDVPIVGGEEKFPVLVFSHGDSNLRTWYSGYCGEMASRGYVVLAVEHRDGSAPGSVLIRPDGTAANVTFFTQQQVSPEMNESEFRTRQLDFRRAEIEEVVKIVRNISQGGGEAIYNRNTRGEGRGMGAWGSRLDLDNLVIGGHSFGGGAALHVLQNSTIDGTGVKGGILLDPGNGNGTIGSEVSTSLLVAASQEWSSQPAVNDSSYFGQAKALAQTAMDKSKSGWYLTLMGSSHVTISDASLIGGTFASLFVGGTFNATINPRDGLTQYVKASTEYFDLVKNGSRTGILDADVTYPDYDKANDTTLNATPGEVRRFWRIHVAPVKPSPPSQTPSSTGSPNKPKTNAATAAFGVQPLVLVLAFVGALLIL